MANVPLSETCACGGSYWHAMMGQAVWCRRCGCLRLIFERYWRVPLDRAPEMAAAVIREFDEELPTSPGTPTAKKRSKDDD